jgi:hypothetical protein
MFQFTPFAPSRVLDLPSSGLPHSDIPGSLLAYSSPGLFAVRHVLPRLAVLRHPPYALTYFHLCLLRSLALSLRFSPFYSYKELAQTDLRAINLSGGPGLTRTADLTLIRRAL